MADLAPADDVLVHREDGDAFLLHVGTGRSFGLNRSGLVRWDALADGRDPVAALRDRWPDLAPDACVADVEVLTGALLHAGLLRPRPG